jgi:microcystin degradation protein MlrC
MRETGEAAARLMLRTLRGEVLPTSALVRLPMLLPPENASHREGPLAEVMAEALALEREPAVLRVGVYAVQPWMDTKDVASSVLVVTDNDPVLAERHARRLAEAFWARRERFVSELVPPGEAIRRALSHDGTTILCDSADSTTSGSTGDSTAILRAALDAAPLPHTALLNVVDPAAVAQAIEAGVGREITLQVGGGLAPAYFAPVAFRGRVKLISDGTFRFKGPGMRGVLHRMGRTVVLWGNGIHLVVMERAVSQWDPQLYRSVGEEPADARMVQVKSPRAFRAAYEGIAERVLIVDAPGAASPKLASLPWQHLPRPIYPLDSDTRWP